MPRLLLAAQTQAHRAPVTAAHSAHNAWTAVFVGLIPIIGLVAVGALVWAFARNRDADESG